MKRYVFALCVLVLLVLVACQQSTSESSSCPVCEVCNECAACSQDAKYCPFDIGFTKTYVREDYITSNSIIAHTITNDVCDKLLLEQETPTGASLCYLKEAEPGIEAGRDDNNDQLWKWRVICACSYEQ